MSLSDVLPEGWLQQKIAINDCQNKTICPVLSYSGVNKTSCIYEIKSVLWNLNAHVYIGFNSTKVLILNLIEKQKQCMACILCPNTTTYNWIVTQSLRKISDALVALIIHTACALLVFCCGLLPAHLSHTRNCFTSLKTWERQLWRICVITAPGLNENCIYIYIYIYIFIYIYI